LITDDDFRKLLTSEILSFIDNCVKKVIGRYDEDIKQDALVKIWSNRKNFDGRYFRAWVYRITYNVTIDVVRKRKVRRTEDVEAYYTIGEDSKEQEAYEAINELEYYQSNLKKEDYKIVELSIIGYSLKEVSKIMNISESLCKYKKYSAIDKIKKLKQSNG